MEPLVQTKAIRSASNTFSYFEHVHKKTSLTRSYKPRDVTFTSVQRELCWNDSRIWHIRRIV